MFCMVGVSACAPIALVASAVLARWHYCALRWLLCLVLVVLDVLELVLKLLLEVRRTSPLSMELLLTILSPVVVDCVSSVVVGWLYECPSVLRQVVDVWSCCVLLLWHVECCPWLCVDSFPQIAFSDPMIIIVLHCQWMWYCCCLRRCMFVCGLYCGCGSFSSISIGVVVVVVSVLVAIVGGVNVCGLSSIALLVAPFPFAFPFPLPVVVASVALAVGLFSLNHVSPLHGCPFNTCFLSLLSTVWY